MPHGGNMPRIIATVKANGYGHGVGMPQWGAYHLAKLGKSAEEIALHYYNGLRLVRVW